MAVVVVAADADSDVLGKFLNGQLKWLLILVRRTTAGIVVCGGGAGLAARPR